eukprot:4226504-Pyramimonas_sp.AAC.1
MSGSMKFRGTTLAAGDAVWCDGVVCIVAGCAFLDTAPVIVVDEMVFVEQVSPAASRWRSAPG